MGSIVERWPEREPERSGRAARNRKLLAQRLKQHPSAARQIRRLNSPEAPLSSAQQRLWLFEKLYPGRAVYNLPCALRFHGSLNSEALEKSLSEVVRRHEALRTNFFSREDEPKQVVSPPQAVRLNFYDLKGVRSSGELEQRLVAEAGRPFNLEHDLMLRGTLFRLTPTEHVLLLTLHHIVSDAWSIELLQEEIIRLYAVFAHGATPSLPELPIQYTDYAWWEREYLRADMLQKQLAYWEKRLAGAPTGIELPLARPRSRLPTYEGATCARRLNPELLRPLSRLAQEQRATLFMTLLSAFQVLLYRITGQEDIVVGVPVSGRVRREMEPLIGFFLNTLPLRGNCSGEGTFLECLAGLREKALEDYRHQEVPFEKIVEKVHPVRETSRTPLFQVMFSLQHRPKPLPEIEDLKVERVEVNLRVSPFDLSLFMEHTDTGLVATFEYATELFDAADMERMLSHFETLLEGVVQNPRRAIWALPLLSAGERWQLRTEFNPRPADFPRECCVHELFTRQALRTPNAVAVACGRQRLSYRELDERSNQLAGHLRKLDVSPEKLVGICLNRSPDMIIAVLGVLKAGGAYLPLDPEYPRERLEFILRDAQSSIVLTERALSHLLPVQSQMEGGALTVLQLDADWPGIAAEDRNAPPHAASPQALVYVVYTSGSTGAPKGVMVEHRCIVSHSVGFAQRFGLSAQDRVLQFAPLVFDVSAEEIFPTLLTGGTLVLRPEDLSLTAFHSFLEQERLTVLNLPVPYWSEWVEEMERSHLTLPPALRLVVVGSDTVQVEQLRRWQRLAGNRVQWCNAYGTTEATITSTIYTPEGEPPALSVPIGKPIRNTCVYILDAHQQLVPIGVPGEIYIGGDEIARGYLNRPERTAEKFVADPFRLESSGRLNRTGDLGRWLPDGNIQFLGRLDHQVKIRGFRVELGEIESVLLRSGLLKEVVVVARQESAGLKKLVAYYVPAEGKYPTGTELREWAKEKLPAYMVPSSCVSLQALPLLPSGKVDRKALPDPGTARPELQEGFVAPRDDLEASLARLWREGLKLEQVGVHDDFFVLGGHSLLAVRLFTEIEKLTGREWPLVTLFQAPTIAGLAAEIRRGQSLESGSSLAPIQAQGSKIPLYLVHGAGGGMLWGYANLAKHLGPDQPVYCFTTRGVSATAELRSMEALAAHYVAELRAFQPQGPYRLGGYCFGGEVAFEMARQLQLQNQVVDFLGLFNAMPPNSKFEQFRWTPKVLCKFSRNAWHWITYFRHWPEQERRNFVKRKWRAAKRFVRRCFGEAEPNSEMERADAQIELSLYSEKQQRLWALHLNASSEYQPTCYAGHIHVFRTAIYPFICSFEPDFGWGEFARGGVTVKVVPGAHESILDEPFVQVLAGEVTESLQQHLSADSQDLQAGTRQKGKSSFFKMYGTFLLWNYFDIPPCWCWI